MIAKKVIDTKAEKKWEKMRNSYEYVAARIDSKPKSGRYNIDLIDLVLVSNFKGGYASIAERYENLDVKLKAYTDGIYIIAKSFKRKKLQRLNKAQLNMLCEQAQSFLQLTLSEKTKIDGFGPSNASALLNIYFPDLLPILDRRVLSGAKICVKKNKQGQVTKIERHYKKLIEYVHRRLSKDKRLSIESLDKKLFSIPILEEQKSPTKPRRRNMHHGR